MLYGDFAFIYDELMDDFDYEAWYGYIRAIEAREGLEAENILEMACGTGNLTAYFARDKRRIDAFDLSLDMLTVADSKLAAFDNVRLYRQNMLDFNFNKKYDLILSICDSINYILSGEELYQTFKNVYDHLEEGGVFIFDINSSHKIRKLIGNNTFIEDREDIFYSWESFYDEEEKIGNFYLNFFVEEDGLYHRFTEEHRERAYELEEVLGLLKRAGFTRVDYYQAFGFDQVEEETERINFVVKK